MGAPENRDIEFRNLGKTFYKNTTKVVALEEFSLTVKNHEFVAVVGPSGCGKSTLLNMAAGLMRPTKGQVIYSGEPVTRVNTRVGYITQKDNLLPWRSVEDNIALALEIRQTPDSDRKKLIPDMIKLVGLMGFEKHYPAELSGGMRKRVGLARTLIYRPETLLMDEPFGALDAQLRLILHDELLRIWEHSHNTIIFVTHDLTEAVSLADKVVVLTPRPGRIKAIQEIDIPRPRDVQRIRFTPKFGQLYEALWEQMKEDMKKGEDV